MGSPQGSVPRAAALTDRYEIENAIGHGGMADVYRGRDRVLNRLVALKVLREATADPAARDRFIAEARTLAGLSHPGLVTVLDAGIDGERPFLVMELVEGRTLADACRPHGLDVGAVARIGAQVADALSYVHGHGVIHRDVKPGNVLLGADGRVLLADFGIARLMEGAAALTATGAMVGTAAYLAPEQLRGGRLGPALDVYALGLVLIEALTGRPAYPGTGVEAAAARLVRPPAIPDGLPPGLSSLLGAMVSLEPAERPTVSDVLAVLRTVAAGSDSPATVRLPAGPAELGSDTRILPAPGAADTAQSAAPASRPPGPARPWRRQHSPQRCWRRWR